MNDIRTSKELTRRLLDHISKLEIEGHVYGCSAIDYTDDSPEGCSRSFINDEIPCKCGWRQLKADADLSVSAPEPLSDATKEALIEELLRAGHAKSRAIREGTTADEEAADRNLLTCKKAVMVAMRAVIERPAPPPGDDATRLDWLTEQQVDTIYFDDGRIIDVGGHKSTPHDIRRVIDEARSTLTKAVSRDLTDYGYAPGNYSAQCLTCRQLVIGCDKRASSCKTCAEQKMRSALGEEVK